MTSSRLVPAIAISFLAAPLTAQLCPVVKEADPPYVAGGNGGAVGSSLTNLGDVDGDGRLDVVGGAPDSAVGDLGIWLLSFHTAPHHAPGTLASQTKLPLPSGVTASPSGRFGAAVATLGDVGSDGSIEVAVGAPGEEGGAGAAYVLSLEPATMAFSVSTRISGASLGFGPGDGFGAALTAVSDLAGDKHPDLVVGAPGCDDGAPDAGALVVLDLDAGASVASSTKITATSGALPGMDLAGGFGSALSNLAAAGFSGDLDHDGTPDLLVGAPHDGKGCLWILFMNPDATIADATRIEEGSLGFTGGLDPGAEFGSSVVTLSADETTRILAVGAPGAGAWADGQGELWYLELAPNGHVLEELRVGPSSGGFGGFPQGADGMGRALAAVGDLDQNGANDLLVGSPGAQSGTSPAVWGLLHDVVLQPRSMSFGDGNPSDLALVAGEPRLGAQLVFTLDDATGQLNAATPLFHVGPDPIGNAPTGVPMCGAVGMLLVDLASATSTPGTDWAPGQPSTFEMTLPLDPALAGTSHFVQGALHAPEAAHLSNAQRLVIAY